MNDEQMLELMMKKIKLKRELLDKDNKEFEELDAQKEKLPIEVYNKLSKELEKKYIKELTKIEKIKMHNCAKTDTKYSIMNTKSL